MPAAGLRLLRVLRGADCKRRRGLVRAAGIVKNPLAREKIARSGEYHDLVSVLDGYESVYHDVVHINAAGNAVVARKIAEFIAPPEAGP